MYLLTKLMMTRLSGYDTATHISCHTGPETRFSPHLELEYVGVVEAGHQVDFLPHVVPVRDVFVHLQHHDLASHQVLHFEHLAEEASTEFF